MTHNILYRDTVAWGAVLLKSLKLLSFWDDGCGTIDLVLRLNVIDDAYIVFQEWNNLGIYRKIEIEVELRKILVNKLVYGRHIGFLNDIIIWDGRKKNYYRFIKDKMTQRLTMAISNNMSNKTKTAKSLIHSWQKP